MWQIANCPCPPDCLTWRPSAFAAPANVSRSGTRSGTCSTSTPYLLLSRSSRTSTWASPMHHRTSCPVSGFDSSRSAGSSATSRPSPVDSLSSSAFDLARIAIGSSGSGMSHASTSSGLSLADSVSPVSAEPSFVTAQMSPARHSETGRRFLPSGLDSAPTFSSASWSGWPRSASPWPDTCTGRSGRSVPLNTRTTEMRPTNKSDVVLITSAHSGPSGSAVSGGTGEPSGRVTTGIVCSAGDGKPAVTSSRTSCAPRWLVTAAHSTGWNDPRATAFSRSSMSILASRSSPPR